MRVQKYPSPLTYANTWPTLASVPAGVVTEEMTPAAFATWLAKQPPLASATTQAEAEALAKAEREEARSAIEEMITIAQTPITTVAQASVAIRKTARAARWLLRNELS